VADLAARVENEEDVAAFFGKKERGRGISGGQGGEKRGGEKITIQKAAPDEQKLPSCI